MEKEEEEEEEGIQGGFKIGGEGTKTGGEMDAGSREGGPVGGVYFLGQTDGRTDISASLQ